VGSREIGYMAGMMKKLTANAGCTFTGKGLTYGGSLIRPEATGYGLVYFAHEMLERAHGGLKGRRVSISGSGNVAQYAADKALEMGAQIVTLSDSGGTAVFDKGLTREQLQDVIEFKEVQRGRMADFCAKNKIPFEAGRKPWHVKADIALPCATENELNAEDARTLVANGVRCVAEGANMPTTLDAVEVFQSAGVLYAPGKASNAGGVATSGLEMSQNAIRLSWTAQEVDKRLNDIMKNIHENCVRHGTRPNGTVDYLAGANIAGFVKLADAMMAQGVL
jgi:glutamate dehydrogenase (NADP+)